MAQGVGCWTAFCCAATCASGLDILGTQAAVTSTAGAACSQSKPYKMLWYVKYVIRAACWLPSVWVYVYVSNTMCMLCCTAAGTNCTRLDLALSDEHYIWYQCIRLKTQVQYYPCYYSTYKRVYLN